MKRTASILCAIALLISCSGNEQEEHRDRVILEPFRELETTIDAGKIPQAILDRMEEEKLRRMAENGRPILEEEIAITRKTPPGTTFDSIADRSLDSTAAPGVFRTTRRWVRRRRKTPPQVTRSVNAALRWLQRHQDEDGRWDQDGFEKHCKGKACGGRGTGQYDVGITGLALLAFLEAGHTHSAGPFRKTVRAGLDWLASRQQEDGLLNQKKNVESWIYNHAIATLALCKAYAMTGDYRLKSTCRKAVDFILNAQNPRLGWKYEPKSGRNDTSVTGWMVLALKTAKTAGLKVDPSAFDGAINWFDRMTDWTGKCGYMEPGDDGSIIRGLSTRYEKLPVMTGVAIICRIFCGQSRRDPKILKGVDLLMANLPDWNRPRWDKINMYYWFWGTLAIRQFGGPTYQKWEKAVTHALLDNQRAAGCADGSWDPHGPLWGMVGGRVYSTAINCMTLAVCYPDCAAPALTLQHKTLDGKVNKTADEPLLIMALKDKEASARCLAARALGERRDDRAIGPLIEALNDKDPLVWWYAAKALKKITNQDFGLNYEKWKQWYEKTMNE